MALLVMLYCGVGIHADAITGAIHCVACPQTNEDETVVHTAIKAEPHIGALSMSPGNRPSGYGQSRPQ